MSFIPSDTSEETKAMGNGFPIDKDTDTTGMLRDMRDKIFYSNQPKIVRDCFVNCVKQMDQMYLTPVEASCLDVCYAKHLSIFDTVSGEVAFHLKQTSPYK